MNLPILYRTATPRDIAELRAMQALAVRRLGARDYDPIQIESFLAHVGTMDDQIVRDGTYYVAEEGGRIVGCGGWSVRTPGYARVGGAVATAASAGPATPKLRSMFVHPDRARRGIGTAIIAIAESAARGAGFASIELTATLTGVHLYRRCGYEGGAPTALRLPDGVPFPVVHMTKCLVQAGLAVPVARPPVYAS